MKREDFVLLHGALCDQLKQITAVKNADYTGSSSTPFHNFQLTEYLGNCTTEQGLIVRLSDKLARITSLVVTGKQHVKDESIEDTLLDMANYAIITTCYLKWKKSQVVRLTIQD